MKSRSKELEALEKVYYGSQGYGNCDENYKIVKQALQRLEAIDNANPSGALKSFETLEKHNEYDNCWQIFSKEIKQALLKAQEPKHYLKWEDLEFMEEKQTMLVLLNGEKYILNYHRTINKTFCYNRCFVQLIRLDVIGANITIANSDFFNDLHLEAVDNE